MSKRPSGHSSTDPREFYDSEGGITVGTYEGSEKELTIPIDEPLRYLDCGTTLHHQLNSLLLLTGLLDNANEGPFIVLDYDGRFIQTLARYMVNRSLHERRTIYYFNPPETIPAFPFVSRRGLGMERAVSTHHAAEHYDTRGVNPLSMWTEDMLEDEQAQKLDWLADHLAAGRNPPEASLKELTTALEKEAASRIRIDDPTKITDYSADTDAHALQSYLDQTIPHSLAPLSNVEHAPMNTTDPGAIDYILVDLSGLSENAQAVLGSLIGWRVYSDLLAEPTATSASLLINDPPKIDSSGRFPACKLVDAACFNEVPLHIVASIPPQRMGPKLLEPFGVRRLPVAFLESMDHPNTDEPKEMPYVIDIADSAPYPALRDRIELTPVRNLRTLIEEPDADELALSKTELTEFWETAQTTAKPYTAESVSKNNLRDETRPAASDQTLTEDGSLWLCSTCQQHYNNYLDALTCHDPAIVAQHQRSTLGFFNLPPTIQTQKTPSGHQLSEAIERLKDRERPVETETEALELLELIRVGGHPKYLQQTTRGLLNSLATEAGVDDERLHELINTATLSRRRYYSLTETARSSLSISLYVDDIPVYGSSLRHNAALADTVRFLNQRTDVDHVLAPYFGRLPRNAVDAAAFNDDGELVCVANVLVDEDVTNFQPLQGAADHLYVLKNSDQAREFLNTHKTRKPEQDNLTVTDPITGEYSIGQLRDQFLINPNDPYPIATHRDIEDRLEK